MKQKIGVGSRVVAPYKDDELKVGRVLDNLATMWYIHFADGTEWFVGKADKRLKLEEVE